MQHWHDPPPCTGTVPGVWGTLSLVPKMRNVWLGTLHRELQFPHRNRFRKTSEKQRTHVQYNTQTSTEEIIRWTPCMCEKYKIKSMGSGNRVCRLPIALKTCSACSTGSNYYVAITVCPSNSSWAPRTIHLKINPPKIPENQGFSL